MASAEAEAEDVEEFDLTSEDVAELKTTLTSLLKAASRPLTRDFPAPHNVKRLKIISDFLFTRLKIYPNFASEPFPIGSSEYEGSVSYMEALPIHHLLYAKAPKAVIEEVYNMYPHAITTVTYKSFLPLHFCIKVGCDVDVIKFLVEKYPEAVGNSDNLPGMMPIDLLMCQPYRDQYSDEDFSTIFQLLYTTCPLNRPGGNMVQFRSIMERLILDDRTPRSLLEWLSKRDGKDDQGYKFYFGHFNLRGRPQTHDTYNELIPTMIENLKILDCKNLTLCIGCWFPLGELLRIDTKVLMSCIKDLFGATNLEQLTLEQVHIKAEDRETIQYLSNLNKHGRCKLIAPNATNGLLEDCVCSVLAGEDESLKPSLLYGLLREAPGLWAPSSLMKRAATTSQPTQHPPKPNKKMKL